MQNTKIFVMPSLSETGGNVILESMSCGLPIISTSVGVASEVIKSGINGYLIDTNNSEEIIKYLELLINDEKVYMRLRVNARQAIVDNFSWEKCAKKYLEVYNEFL